MLSNGFAEGGQHDRSGDPVVGGDREGVAGAVVELGQDLGVGAGSIMHSYVQKLPFEKQVKVYKSTGDVLFAVLSKAVDATFAYTVMEPAIKRNYPKVKVHFGPELWSVPLGYMVREDNDQARLALNSAIQAYFSTNSYAFLSSKHFGKDVRCKG